MSDDRHHTDGGGPGLAAAVAMSQDSVRADTFLDEHTKLARLQREQLEEENTTRKRLLRLEHASALFKLALEIAIAAVVAAIVIGLSAAIWNAATDSGLVVETFSVPPDLASRGLTGDVVAAKLLDKLSSLQRQTVSNRAPSSYANNWGSDIKLQIPDTGVSIGEFIRTLHTWLGHQTRITGEVYRTPKGIAVTARVGSGSGPTFTGGDADLDTLMQKAAESVYGATQPYRYAVYLTNAGRVKESEPAYRQLIAKGDAVDRAWALIGIENIYTSRGENERALRTLYRALQVRPDFIMAWFNIAGIEGQLQHDEESFAAQKKVVAILRRGQDKDISPQSTVMSLPAAEAQLASSVGDYAKQIAFNATVEQQPDVDGQVEIARQNDAVAYAFLHDGAAMRGVFAQFEPSGNPQILLNRAGNRAFADLVLGDPRTVLKSRARFDAFFARIGPGGEEALHRQFWPITALALAMTGDMAGAHKLADTTPLDCVICLRIRARVARLEKNWSGADYWYARAVHASPSLPFAYTDWGRALLEKGDADRAIAMFRKAGAASPNYADAIALWGEALMRKNRSDLALAKFAQAAKLAPNWGRLHLKWGEALFYAGEKDEAKKQYAMAAGLDLSPAERAELGRVGN